MSFDRVDPYSAGYGRQGPPRPSAPPPFGKSPGKAAGDNLPALGIPLANATSESFTKDWLKDSATYGSHSIVQEALNRAAAPETAFGKKLQVAQKSIQPIKIIKPTNPGASPPKVVSYSELLNLGNKQTPIHKMSWERFSGTWKENLNGFVEKVKPANIGGFFDHTSAKNYVKHTVVNGNIQPIKDLATNSNNREIGTGVLKTAAMGLLGYDVLKHTHTAYKNAQAQEDGTFKSRLHTYNETAKSFGKYTFRDGTSWEFAGIGAAVGKALLPLALGGVSLGGILVGALAGVAVQKGLDKVLHTGEHDPNQPARKQGDNDPEEDGNDAGRGLSLKR